MLFCFELGFLDNAKINIFLHTCKGLYTKKERKLHFLSLFLWLGYPVSNQN